MCGRFAITKPGPDVNVWLGVDPTRLAELVAIAMRASRPAVLNEPDPAFAPRYNIAPTQPVAVIAGDAPDRIQFFQWGLIPFWAKDPSIGSKLINARAETLAEKPSFRRSFRERRCLILADAFYEWAAEPGRRGRTPICIRLRSGEPFAFAGLWDEWRSPEGDLIRTCAIVTTTPNEMMARFHHRMPVILPRESRAAWLDRSTTDPAELQPLLTQYPAEKMECFAISTAVNNPRNDRPELLEPAGQLSFFAQDHD